MDIDDNGPSFEDRIPLPSSFPEDIGSLDFILKEDGALSKIWDGFQPRKAQQRMFQEASRAFRDGDISIIEAGTGTGKTLAYLLPAIISRKKTLVSTGLKNLQEQIFEKDLKFIRNHFDADFKAAILKGRDNYCCLRRLTSVIASETARTAPKLKKRFEHLRTWYRTTRTGETSELSYALLQEPPFDRLTSSSDTCVGSSCRHHDRCYVVKARARAADADIILVNHSLFLTDLVLKEKDAAILPDWDAVIFDEAHLLESTAVRFFAKELSSLEVRNACYEFSRLLTRIMESGAAGSPGSDGLAAMLNLLEKAENQQEFSAMVSNHYGKVRSEELLWPETPETSWSGRKQDLKKSLDRLRMEIKDLLKASSVFAKSEEDFGPLTRRLDAIADSAMFIAARSNSNYIYTVKTQRDDVILSAVPIQVAEYLNEKLFSRQKTIILTSATLATGGSLEYFNSQLGIPQKVSGLVLASPFDHWSRTRMYIPGVMPDPDFKDRYAVFGKALVKELESILKITRGRALILFTSHYLLNIVHDAMRNRTPWRLIKQGDDQRTTLLNDFRRDVNSVLMATLSFWQGVDVPGESLTALIIDKLPFPSFTDPLNVAKKNLLSQKGKNPFNNFDVPEAEVKLKQGIGRLLRSTSDWGLVAVMDRRIQTMPYGKALLRSIPHGPITNKLSAVADFFKTMEGAKV
jgi:ATP-dependent DNA helicase DinG